MTGDFTPCKKPLYKGHFLSTGVTGWGTRNPVHSAAAKGVAVALSFYQANISAPPVVNFR